jgi:hypothetical protein
MLFTETHAAIEAAILETFVVPVDCFVEIHALNG